MLGVAALLGLTLGPIEVAPEPRTGITLEVTSAKQCADEAALRSQIDRYLAGSGADDEPVTASLHTNVEETGIRATLQITTATGHSSRELAAANCNELVDAVAVVVAMAVDPLLALPDTSDPAAPEPEPEPAPEPEPEPIPEPEPEPEPDPEPEPEPVRPVPLPAEPAPPPKPSRPRRQGTRFVASASGGAAGGLLPGASGLLEGVAGVQWRSLRVAAAGHYQFRRTRGVDNRGSVAIAAWGLGAHACFVPTLGRIELAGCGVFEAGQAIGTGQDLPTTASASRPWIGLGARAALDVRITRWLYIELAVQGLAHPLIPTFNVAGVGEVHTARAVGGRAIGGLQLRFP
ncbi:MAG: hypothetical protein AAF721_14980 [Myxococcota bacterium]